MGLFFSILNPNYRQPSEDEIADYTEQAREERYEKKQARRWSNNESKHYLDPDREGVEEE